ncbi:Paf1-domain-containing protein [Lepidopterella palustris CBS 459.81]|uniref:Paf1-domain-containing protein n=1 Tax=Lepidopterella palustris CBS 459.81 TaxID=1314670 RepID=A0A8E2EFX8_9PEZI|nr:Paf1-domain-containing protein [Lepidopterella palustris CBS 459.81]
MAASSGRPTYHQDYIARIRYSNALPPPPCPPKLLEIPNTGLASGQYTSAGFASRLARDQPLNIEADAELGMPIDLVGLPGVFDGNETAIQALDNPPPPHPHDRALLRPLAALGKPTSITSGVSFLRRTEYITSVAAGGSRFESSSSSNTMRTRNPKRRRADISKDDPVHILRAIIKGFDIAYPQDAYTGPDSDKNIRGAEITTEEKKAWARPVHPTKKDVQLLDSYPILPDLDALPDTGSYMVYKFITCPVSSTDKYDERLDVAFLRPLTQPAEDLARMEAQQAAHDADPSQPAPIPQFDYEFFLPSNSNKVRGIKRNFGVIDPDNEEEVEFDGESKDSNRSYFKYERVRAYETYQQTGDPGNVHGDIVAVALHDPEATSELQRENPLQKAAYYYPVIQKTLIRPRRPAKKGAMASQINGEEETRVDVVEARGRDPDVNEVERRVEIRNRYDVEIEA